MTENEIASPVLDAAFLLHTKPDLGLLETVVLAHELRKKGLSVERQLPMPIVYDGIRFGLSDRFARRFQSDRGTQIS